MRSHSKLKEKYIKWYINITKSIFNKTPNVQCRIKYCLIKSKYG